jgi:hypothetical protein
MAMADNWLAHLDPDSQERFWGDLAEARAAAANTADPRPIEDCLRGWRATAQALRGPVAREVLTSTPDNSEFAEVGRPA